MSIFQYTQQTSESMMELIGAISFKTLICPFVVTLKAVSKVDYFVRSLRFKPRLSTLDRCKEVGQKRKLFGSL